MNAITLTKKALQPYETLAGEVAWQLDEDPGDLELRLFWYTRGRGDEEAETAHTLKLGSTRSGRQSFSIPLPGWPWSVDGTLVSIVWAVELVDGKGKGLAMEEFIMGPAGHGTRLRAIDDPKSEGKLVNKIRRMNHNRQPR